MARLVGVEKKKKKRVEVALTYIYGIGLPTSKQILSATKINPDTRVKDLNDTEIRKLYEYIDKNVSTEGQVKQKIFLAIKRLKDIRTYRGMRHKVGLPVRGQNTRSNGKTRKGKSIAVGGLKVKLAK